MAATANNTSTAIDHCIPFALHGPRLLFKCVRIITDTPTLGRGSACRGGKHATPIVTVETVEQKLLLKELHALLLHTPLEGSEPFLRRANYTSSRKNKNKM